MKKLLAFLVLAFAVVCSAQSLKPEFQAFSGALLKLKKVEKGFHKFQLKVEAAPWAFMATGEVQAPGGDGDVLITGLFDGELYAVIAYVPSPAVGSDGLEYQAGFFDMMIYYEEEPTRVRNLKFKLLPPADDEWAMGILKDALESGSLIGNVWGGKYDRAITKASADPMDKTKLLALQKKNGSRNMDNDGTISSRKRRVEAKEAPAPAAAKEVPAKKSKHKKVSSSDSCDAPGLSVKEKRQCQMRKKK